MNDYLLMIKTITSLWGRNHHLSSSLVSSHDNKVMTGNDGVDYGGGNHTNDRNDGNGNEKDGIVSNNTSSVLSINSSNNNNNSVINNDSSSSSNMMVLHGFIPSSSSPRYRNSPRLWKILKQHEIHRSDDFSMHDSRGSSFSCSRNVEDKSTGLRNNNYNYNYNYNNDNDNYNNNNINNNNNNNNNNEAAANAATAADDNNVIVRNDSSKVGDDQIERSVIQDSDINKMMIMIDDTNNEISMESLVTNNPSSPSRIHIDNDNDDSLCNDDHLFTIDSPSFIPSPYLSSSYTSSPPLYPNRLQNLQSISKIASSSSSSSSSSASSSSSSAAAAAAASSSSSSSAHKNKDECANADDDLNYTRSRAATIIGIDSSMQVLSPERSSIDHHDDDDDDDNTAAIDYNSSTIQHAINSSIMTDGSIGIKKTFTLLKLQVCW